MLKENGILPAPKERELALIDVDGTIAPTNGECHVVEVEPAEDRASGLRLRVSENAACAPTSVALEDSSSVQSVTLVRRR